MGTCPETVGMGEDRARCRGGIPGRREELVGGESSPAAPEQQDATHRQAADAESYPGGA